MSDPIFSLGTESYHPYTLDEALTGAGKAGFRYVELAAIPQWSEHLSLDLDNDGIDNLKEKLDNYGLKVSGINANTGLMTEEGATLAKKAISIANKLGASIVSNTISGPEPREIPHQFMKFIGNVAEHAKSEGVLLGIEIHGEHTSNGALTKKIIEQVNHPNVKINYDTGNCVYFGDTWPYEDLEKCISEVAQVHLKDKIGGKGIWDFPPVGQGEIDFIRVFDILNTANYCGSMSVEIEYKNQLWPPVSEVDKGVAFAFEHTMALINSRQ